MTVFFSDVVGSTALGERVDPEVIRGVMNRYFAKVSAALERHGGHLEKFIGDAVVALFGVPAAHEDDALRCVRAAVEARDAVRALGDELESTLGVRLAVRIGVATGEVVMGAAPGGRLVATGDAMNTAARLEQAAPVGEILIGASTQRLVRGSVEVDEVAPLELKGKSNPVAAFRVIALGDDHARGRQPGAARLVGRVRERRMLQDGFDRAAEERSCQLVTVLGTAGVGKSRLVGEFLAGLQETTVCVGRCLSYGEGVTYWALAEAVKALVGVGEDHTPEQVHARLESFVEPGVAREVAEGVGSLLGLAGASARVEDARVALGRLFEAAASHRPLVVVLDDIHWAEPPLLDLIDYLADWLDEAPVLLVCMARPELLEERPGWSGGKLNATTLLLEPLSSADSVALVRELLGADVPVTVAERVVEAAEGNPLFVEELVAMLVDQGHLRRKDGRVEVVGPIDRIDLPPTIQALLTARLDRLSSLERGMVQRASIEGQVFHVGALEALGADRQVIASTVRTLARKQMLRTDRPALPGQDAYRFRHLLIREAAYQRVTKEVRARWHEAFADWLEALAGARVSEYEELVAHHLAVAALYRREIGSADEPAAALARRAGTLFRRAADRAAAQADFLAGAALLRRVGVLGRADDPATAIALADCASWLAMAGRLDVAAATSSAAVAAARSSGDRTTELVCEAIRRMIAITTTGSRAGEEEAALDHARRAAEESEKAGRFGEAARLWYVVSRWEGHTLLRCSLAREAAERTLRLAQTVGTAWLEAFGAVGGVLFLMRGRGRIADVLEAGEAASGTFGRAIRADYLADAASLLAQRGDADAALEALSDMVAVAEELGFKRYITDWIRGAVLVDAGRPGDAIEPLGAAAAAAGAAGDVGSAATILGLLARTLACAGRSDEALRQSIAARALASPSDRWSQLLWRGAALRACAASGRPAEALTLADELVALLAHIDYPGIEFHARLDAAEGFRAAGHLERARALLQRALADSEEREAREFVRQAAIALESVGTDAAARAGTRSPTA